VEGQVGTFKQMSSSEMREARKAYAAEARSQRLTLAYARLVPRA